MLRFLGRSAPLDFAGLGVLSLLLNWVGLCFIQAHWLDWVSHRTKYTLCIAFLSYLSLCSVAFWSFYKQSVWFRRFFLYLFAGAYPTPVFLSIWLAGTLATLLARLFRLSVIPYAGVWPCSMPCC